MFKPLPSGKKSKALSDVLPASSKSFVGSEKVCARFTEKYIDLYQ